MAANSSLTLSSLDYNTLLQNFKNFASANSVFQDYNLDGSNANWLLKQLAYNSYLNSFYLNMVFTEMFLDSAQKYDSVVSKAKELNYLPQSAKSSAAFINFSLDTVGLDGKLYIPKNFKFIGSNSNGTFTFTTDQISTYTSSNGTYNVANLAIYEGLFYQDTYIVDYNIESQKFLISNKNVDLDSLQITVTEDSTNTIFNYAETLFGLTSQSNVYFLQGAQDHKYEIVFGDNLFGRYPKNEAIITASYRISSGAVADGISYFQYSDDLELTNSGTITTNPINVIANSSSGSSQEDIESIRFSAPRYFATQQRAISKDDHEALILNNFGGEISDVNIYGGQDLEPKQYGRVVVCIKPKGAIVAPNYIKNKIQNFLKDFVPLPNRIILSDPDYFYLAVNTTVQYSPTLTNKYSDDIETVVRSVIATYSESELEQFESDFRYSRFVSNIDNGDASIISNDTYMHMGYRITPLIDYPSSYVINFNNKLAYDTNYKSNEPLLTSSVFDWINENGVTYNNCYMKDDGNGNIIIYYYVNSLPVILHSSIGTVDYTTGKVIINKLRSGSYINYIDIRIKPYYKDLFAKQNMILLIDPADVNVTIIEKLN